MEKTTQMYEGKAKKVFATNDPEYCIVSYKDDATAFNGLKKGTILGKGAINNRVTNHLMKLLERNGVPTHLVEELNDRETVVRRVQIVPLEVIVRNVAAGSLAKRLGLEERISRYFSPEEMIPAAGQGILAFQGRFGETYGFLEGICDKEAVLKLFEEEKPVLSEYLKESNIELIDFKLEFGRTSDGKIVLADEISPDTCRFWDMTTHEKLDKDRFRRDLGGVEDAYQEILRRLLGE